MQRPEGSLCDALADIVGDLAHVVAARTTHGVALSWRPSGPSHHQPLGGSRLPTRAPALPHPQAHYSTLAETRLRRASPRVRHRRPHDSAPPRASKSRDDGSLSAYRDDQSLLDLQSTRPAPSSGRVCASAHHASVILSAGSVSRPTRSVADVFHRYGPTYCEAAGAAVSTAQRRVMTAIEQCRTAALGGHVEQCDGCGHTRVWYNSCRNRHCPTVSPWRVPRGSNTAQPKCSTPSISTSCSPCQNLSP